jgi:hypothetical protein
MLDLVHLPHDSVHWRALVYVPMNLRAPYSAINFLTSCRIINFSRSTLLHRVSRDMRPVLILKSVSASLFACVPQPSRILPCLHDEVSIDCTLCDSDSFSVKRLPSCNQHFKYFSRPISSVSLSPQPPISGSKCGIRD